MQIFLNEFSKVIDKNKHAALIIDNAGWHRSNDLNVPTNITLVPLPPYSPELNPMEGVWEWIKQRHLSNRCYKNYDEIVDYASLIVSLCALKILGHPCPPKSAYMAATIVVLRTSLGRPASDDYSTKKQRFRTSPSNDLTPLITF